MLYAVVAVAAAVLASSTAATSPEFNATSSLGSNHQVGGSRKYTWDSALPPRLQWLPNSGYCGEVSTIMALLKVGGSYYSQYDVRAISAIAQSNVQVKHFYLVGENDQRASGLLKLTYEEFDNANVDTSPKRYLSWLKAMTKKGYAVTPTVFMNHYQFYGMTNLDAGEADYDHIVSVSRVESDYDDEEYHDDDLITIEDHGLWAPGNKPVYLFTYTMKDFIGTRKQANAQSNPNIYTIPFTNDYGNFGIAHTGMADDDKSLLPILVETNVNYESPHIKNNSEDRPEAMELTLTVTVSGLQKGVNYKLYKYNDETLVPTSAFNANSPAVAVATHDISGASSSSSATYVLTEKIMSNEKAIYRCVREDAK